MDDQKRSMQVVQQCGGRLKPRWILVFSVVMLCSVQNAALAGSATSPDQGSIPAVVTPSPLADARQLAATLDLRTLPTPKGTTIDQQLPTTLQCRVPLRVSASARFFSEKLQALGWQQAASVSGTAISDSYAQLVLIKNGFLLSLAVMPGGGSEDSRVVILHLGNLDTRTIPKLAGAEDTFDSPTTTVYFTSAKVDAATETLRQRLSAAGWQEYDRAHSQKAVIDGFCSLTFRQNACSLGVTISRAPAKPGKASVQYIATTLARDLPAPSDARKVQLDDTRWYLSCEIPRDLAAVAQYYREAMPKIGFAARPSETPNGNSLSLSFASDNHDVMLVQLKSTGDHSTLATLQGMTAETIAQLEATRQKHDRSQPGGKPARTTPTPESNAVDAEMRKAISEAADPDKQTPLSRQIQAKVKAQLDEAMRAVRSGDLKVEEDQSAERSGGAADQ